MGRLEPSTPVAPQAHRKEQRAKHARVTINKTIPAILASDPRARQGVAQAELLVNPQPVTHGVDSSQQHELSSKASRHSRDGKKRAAAKDEGDEVTGTTSVQNRIEPLRIKIKVSDTLAVARELHLSGPRSRKNVAVLNMASPLRPGGGVLNGATSQEESLCVRSTLLPSLKEEWYRLPEVGAIWSPDVCVFRVPNSITGQDEELGKGKRFYVDVISAGMLRFPEVVSQTSVVNEDTGDAREESTEQKYANPKDREMALNKMKAAMRILQNKGTERVVLGAWGCGAYGNPVAEIVDGWKKILLGTGRSKGKGRLDPKTQGTQWFPVKEIVFAIKDRNMARTFATLWGSEVELDEVDKPERASQLINDDETQDLKELETKIDDLELQLKQVKTPLLRKGIEDTLKALRLQSGAREDAKMTSNRAERNQSEYVDDESINDSEFADGKV
jgi:hypothetical protein